MPSVTVRSPLGASPTSMEAQTDTPTPPTDTAMPQAEETSGTTVVREGPKYWSSYACFVIFLSFLSSTVVDVCIGSK